ncbi:hypothetical protein BU17DRAFT_38847 [Hysterangium stoloniferum]|nr:hypothetical protein BU17DRAFT_38847 [Hysterangium stoloniferum]
MAPYSKPETVLKQAEGLISVGQSHAALQSLTEMFSSKRFRSTPLASLEPIMIRFVELCVDMRKGRTAKEGLMQYKNIAQNTSVASIEVVIKRFVQLADAKVQEAQEKADKAVALVDVDDLEASETPEGILLGAVSGDQNKDRTDRALVTPWLKFLWESYRTALETLKNNARLEAIYQQIAHQAFKFCLKHVRKVEFRRLCETLRLHLANVAKYSHQPHSINLSDPDTLQHHLDTRFAQLNTSVELELWQEAFRSVEDIHNLLTMAKKAPRPAMMANYYEKLTRIFLTSGNALFHAAAWSRYYAIIRTSGGKSEEELSKLAGLVLISALAVPVTPESEDEVEEGKGRNGRLTALLALSKMPTRVGLLNEALSRNTLKLSPIYVRALYEILEVSFEPLSICSKVAPVFRELAKDASYAPYLPLLHRVLVTRLLSQLSEVYSSIKITHLLSLVAPLNGVASEENPSDEPSLEAFIMSAAHHGELLVRVDHAQGTITFTQSVFASTSVATVQPSPSSLVVSRISSLANMLHNTLQTIHPSSHPSQEDRLQALVVAAQAERKAIIVRQLIVGRRRELLSEISVRKEKEEASRKAEQARREKEEDAKRAVEDVRRREQERVRQTIEHNRAEEARRLAQALKGTLKGPVEEIDTSDPDALIRMQVAHLEKEKRELNERLRIVSKRVDHLERAFRKEERPLLSEDYERQQADDREAYEATLKDTIVASKEKFTMDMVTKKRLSRILGDYKGHRELIMGRRQEELNVRKAAAQVKINEEKAKRRATILKTREAERKKKEEEERLAREAEEARIREQEALRAEEDRKRAEAEAAREEAEAKVREEEERREAIRKQRAEERAATAEAARLQQQREDEAMRRREERAAASKTPLTRAGPPIRATPAEGVWRRTSQAAGTATPSRSGTDSSRPIPESPSGPQRTRPIVFSGKPGGWKEREAAKEAAKKVTSAPDGAAPVATATTVVGNGEASSPSASTPVSGTGRASAADDDGFQTVPKKAVWRSSRGRGSGGI